MIVEAFSLLAKVFRWIISGGTIAVIIKILIIFPPLVTIIIGVISGIIFGAWFLLFYIIHHIAAGLAMGHHLSGH